MEKELNSVSDSIESEMSFPYNTMKNSTVKYLQGKIAEKCAALPKHFNSLSDWELFKKDMVGHLKDMLFVPWLAETYSDYLTAKMELGAELVIEAIDVKVEGNYYVPVHLYRMKHIDKAAPAVLVCPGYAQQKNSADIADICISLARRGIIAVAVEYGGTGECSDRPDNVTNINNVTALALMLGISDVSIRVLHNMSVLRYLKTRTDIDPARIGITGLCQGSIVLWYTAALCEEFSAIAPLCGTTTLEAEALEYTNRQGGWSGTSPFIFSHLSYCDVQHLYGCFAPRPLFVQNNIVDVHWPYSGLYQVMKMTDNIYGLYNAKQKYSFILEHEAHAFTGKFIYNLVEWFSGVFC